MSRYIYNNRIKLENVHQNDVHFNKEGFDSTIYPRIKRQPGDTVIIATRLDRLDLLAHRFYKNRTFWWIISLANNLPGDSFYIEPGKQIFIPKDIEDILNRLRIKNSVGE